MTTSFISTLKPFIQQIWEKSEFQEPTAIQQQAIPAALEGKDLLIESPTGTGKTLAYLLPILEKVEANKQHPQAIILVPSKELAMQILEQIQKWSEGTDITGASFIGGANIKRQIEKLKKKPEIIVGTPGRLAELIQMKKIKMHEMKTVVLDEGDQLLTSENMKSVKNIVKSTLSERQVMLVSATLKEEANAVAKEFMQDPVTVKVERDEKSKAQVEHYYVVCEKREKVNVLANVLRQPGIKALAFVRDIGNLAVVTEKLTYKQLNVGVLHGDSSKKERETALKDFRREEYPILLATDVAARGLDINEVTHVVHFDVPLDAAAYTHRSGRTGRQGATGTVISLVAPTEERDLKRIARDLNLTLIKREIYGGRLVEPKEVPAKSAGNGKRPNSSNNSRPKNAGSGSSKRNSQTKSRSK
ncbi:DEAD/DEAH box helicase [Sutcliffiella cohnii]